MTEKEKDSYFHTIAATAIYLINNVHGKDNTDNFIDFIKNNYSSFDELPYIDVGIDTECDCDDCVLKRKMGKVH